jgi:hypothetical protein
VNPGDIVTAAQDSAYGLLVLVVLAAVWAFYSGKVHSDREFSKLEAENKALREAQAADRARADEVTRAGAVTNQLISALTQVAADRSHAIRGELTGQEPGP